jgi:phosphohistidine phosphatase
MKKLIFVRHGKAEDDIPGLSDFERSLTERGKKISKRMAEAFSKKEGSPGLLLSSPAFRALETGLVFAGVTGVSYDKIVLHNNLYFGTNTDKILKLLQTINDEIQKVTMFGHNPSFTDAPDALSETGCGPVPKSGVVCISFKAEKWADVKAGEGKLEYFLKPDR